MVFHRNEYLGDPDHFPHSWKEMKVAPRQRTVLGSRAKGTRTRFGGTEGGFQVNDYKAYCSDQTGSGDNAPFFVEKITAEGGVINNPFYSYFGPYFVDYKADCLDNLNNLALHSTFSDIPSLSDAATSAAARTNPSSPWVNVPGFMYELREIFELFPKLGKKLFTLRNAANINLNSQFGWNPAVQDLAKIIDFSGALDRQIKKITKLMTEKGFRKTVSIGSWSSGVNAYSDVPQSADSFIQCMFYHETKLEMRAHCRWMPTADFPQSIQNTDDIRSLARRAMYGLTIDSYTIWEALPWSWLVDWGSNIGDYLKSQRNMIPCELVSCSVMRHYTTTTTSDPYAEGPPKNLSMTPIKCTRETKMRDLASPAPSAHIPFLTGNQMGILGSLAITRL
jgi:hypothetical protein